MTQGIHLGGIPSHSAAPQLLGASQGQISPNQLQLQLQQRLQSPQQAPMNVQAMMQQRHSSTQLYMHPITNTVTAGAPHPITQFSPISPNLIIQQGNSGMIQQQTARVEMGPATCSYEHVRGNSLEQNNLQFPTADMTHQSDPAYGGQGPLTSLGMSHLRRSALTDFRPISPDLGWQPIPGVTNTPNAQNRGCVSRPQHMVTPGMYVHPTAVSRPSECIEPPGMQVVRMGTEQQVEVYADVQCTVNLLENDSYLCQPPGGLACVTQPVVSMPGHVQGSSLLQQLLTE
uniref:Uncharacterized protein n=1 Tax=Eptatretus burgeri TaxID=7764 RepID=A0A8C4X2D8_EPTBU